ncbi:hypothetical protein [Clostridium sporogenes]|uniref:hypothetical protein n=1 Tax=Clostridium sporogenes TaxID=1509 RepID=UPI00024BA466|nr:hypothetical protein [Clostridium sporogenes]EHN17011.1 hypothetical protein IYC_00497 [Clostridium sporogenes PA 3679]NFQ35974.1 hypothetical protein [Clostridium sporogenes]NFQ60568.1 hypothetical protein [Clostridium sporogenes]NFU11129.1 hypothetical protein [Clostridium sporogenes]NFU43921.1 hypothetical protein [Clostridium sporogenes]
MAGEIFIARQDTLENVKYDTENILNKVSKKANNTLIREYTAGEDLEVGNVVELFNRTVIKSKLKSYTHNDTPVKCDYNSIFFRVGVNQILKLNKYNAQILTINSTNIFLGTKIEFTNTTSDYTLLAQKMDDSTFLLIFYSFKGSFLRILNLNNGTITLGNTVSIDAKERFSIGKMNNTKAIVTYIKTSEDRNVYGRVVDISNGIITLGIETTILVTGSIPNICLCNNDKFLLRFSNDIVAIAVNNLSINILDRKSFETMYDTTISKLDDNKYIVSGDSGFNNATGYSQVIKLSGSSIVMGTRVQYQYGYQPKIVVLNEEKALLISSDNLKQAYCRILKVNDMTIECGNYTLLTEYCFYFDVYKLDANRILYYGFRNYSSVFEARMIVIKKDNTIATTKQEYSNKEEANLFPNITPIDGNRILAIGQKESSSDSQYIKVISCDDTTFAKETIVTNNPILGIVTADARKGTTANILLRGAYDFNNLSFEENCRLNNVNGKLKPSYIDGITPYAVSLDERTIEILNPYSRENTI